MTRVKKHTREKVIQIFKDAWDDFKNYFDEKCRCYSSGMITGKAEEEHWVCWTEFDLLIHIARFCYKRLEESGLDNVEIHINESLKPSNFREYRFYDNLKKVRYELGRFPQPDLIIAFEDNFSDPFILCAEAKCLRYPVERRGRIVTSDLEKDKETLLILKRHDICSHLAYILLDDYYFIHNKKIAKEIINKLNEYSEKYGITKLYHTSRAKIPYGLQE